MHCSEIVHFFSLCIEFLHDIFVAQRKKKKKKKTTQQIVISSLLAYGPENCDWTSYSRLILSRFCRRNSVQLNVSNEFLIIAKWFCAHSFRTKSSCIASSICGKSVRLRFMHIFYFEHQANIILRQIKLHWKLDSSKILTPNRRNAPIRECRAWHVLLLVLKIEITEKKKLITMTTTLSIQVLFIVYNKI